MKYVIIEDMSAEINFDEITQDKIYDYLYDNLQQRYVISYDGEMPPSVKRIENKSEEYTKDEIVRIMADPVWAIYDNLSENDITEYDDHINFYNELL